LDAQVAAFRQRPLEGRYPYLWLDAKVRHEAPRDRAGGRSPPVVCRSRPLKLGAA
jgi:transposase-like protein